MTSVRAIAADLAAEQGALDEVVARLSDGQWAMPTPSEGWTVADQIGHLTYFDGAAATAITDPEAFTASVTDLMKPGASIDDLTLRRDLAPRELLTAWRANRAHLAEAAPALSERTRLLWYGPPMSGKSFLTARLMEVWAHGHDITVAVGAEHPASDRLRHIAQLGVITRAWSYKNRGMAVPEGGVRVELTAPSGGLWCFGLDDPVNLIRGPAVDFCLVVTQRRHVQDTRLDVKGDIARDWMEKAQAFAGPATDGPAPQGT